MVRVIKLRRNFGQTAGLQAGFDHSRGDVIISMDGDLQHAPEEIPQFLAKIDEGYDIVSGWRKDRKDNALLRKFPSWVANRMMKRLVKVKIHDFGTTYKAYRREVIQSIRLFGELHRFIPALISREGFKITEHPDLQHQPAAGQVQLRPLAGAAGLFRPDDGQVYGQLHRPAAPDLRPPRA